MKLFRKYLSTSQWAKRNRGGRLLSFVCLLSFTSTAQGQYLDQLTLADTSFADLHHLQSLSAHFLGEDSFLIFTSYFKVTYLDSTLDIDIKRFFDVYKSNGPRQTRTVDSSFLYGSYAVGLYTTNNKHFYDIGYSFNRRFPYQPFQTRILRYSNSEQQTRVWVDSLNVDSTADRSYFLKNIVQNANGSFWCFGFSFTFHPDSVGGLGEIYEGSSCVMLLDSTGKKLKEKHFFVDTTIGFPTGAFLEGAAMDNGGLALFGDQGNETTGYFPAFYLLDSNLNLYYDTTLQENVPILKQYFENFTEILATDSTFLLAYFQPDTPILDGYIPLRKRMHLATFDIEKQKITEIKEYSIPKLDLNGDTMFHDSTFPIHLSDHFYPRRMIFDANDDILILGNHIGGLNYSAILKLDGKSKELLWRRDFYLPEWHNYHSNWAVELLDMDVNASNQILVSGHVIGPNYKTHSYFAVLDEYGCLQKDCQFPVGFEEMVENKQANNWLVYPNPTSNRFYVSGTSTEIHQARLYSSMGQLIQTYSSSQLLKGVDVSRLPKGMYLLRLYLPNGATEVKKVMIE